MTSLLGRLLRLFPEGVPLEDLFTEAVARLFERRSELCIAWLEEAGLLSPGAEADGGYARVSSQRTFVPLEHHDTASRPDLLVEVYRSSGDDPVESDSATSIVMVESKIGSGEGQDQLRRYAEHLDAMVGYEGKALLYVTRAYDPKVEKDILVGLSDNVCFKQLRWHDFYRFLRAVEKDALVEEVMTFMEEQGMARDHRFSTTDLIALSGVPRTFDLLEETLGGEVKAEQESFAGHRSRLESAGSIRYNRRCIATAQLHGWDLFCGVGYQVGNPEHYPAALRIREDYPAALVMLEARPGAAGREVSMASMKRLALREGWNTYNMDDPSRWVGVRRTRSLASILLEEDHIAAVKSFFIESIRQLKEELTAFKKDHPELPWERSE